MTTDLSKSGNVQNGVTFGVLIGLVYCISLFARFNVTSSGPIAIGAITLCFYLGVIALLFFCAIKRRKELGGFIDLKEAFQTIFIAIIIGELIYMIFNYIYLRFIDPNYFDKLYTSMETFFEKTSMSDEKKEEALNKMRAQFDTQKTKGMTAQGILLSYLISVAVTGIFGFIASLIVRKRKEVFDTVQDNQSI